MLWNKLFWYLDHCVNKDFDSLHCLILSSKILVSSIVEIMAMVQTLGLASYIYIYIWSYDKYGITVVRFGLTRIMVGVVNYLDFKTLDNQP